MPSPKEQAVAALARISTFDELEKELAKEELTPEEKRILEDPHLFDEPTAEDIRALGLNFAQRVRQLTLDRVSGSEP